ncbi:MAG: hypothetical protein GXP29_12210 [Planctomycetes bacterium]|nr:hypothetical protein [Planctomycetota bacterium]
MIEFKGECGHTIRARDEDAGKVVRCSYCGKEALVTQQPQNDLDLLFDQVEQTGAYDAQATRVGQKVHRVQKKHEKRLVAGKPVKAFDPFDVAMKMTYVAVVIIIVYLGIAFVPAWYDMLTGGSSQDAPTQVADSPAQAPGGQPTHTSQRRGLLSERLSAQQEGAYVSSFPQGAGIYHLPKFSVTGSILGEVSANKHARTNKALRLRPGQHTIAVALRVNHSSLMRLPGYENIRRQIESNDGDIDRLVQNFFVPDGSIATRVEKLRGALHLVRIFECEIDGQSWEPVTALFLPRKLSAKQVVDCLPSRKAYGFDRIETQRELDFYRVPAGDQQKYVTDALERVGMVSYCMEDGQYWLFRIEPTTGAVMSKKVNQ